jgi:triphosphoribosyl-dephospho-CoA synthase
VKNKLSTGLCAQLACIWEATARKPGNVHRYCDFDDCSYPDFLVSAAAIGPVFDHVSNRRVGETVLEAVRATRRVTASNTNLGIILLLAPLAAVPRDQSLRAGLSTILSGLDIDDARAAYQAIRLARPGGLGRVDAQDVSDEPTNTLLEVMGLAAERDLVARQYVNNYHQVFEDGVPALRIGFERLGCLEGAIIYCHLTLLSRHPDSLIARKRGPAEAEEATRRAQQVLAANWPDNAAGVTALREFDAWLRAEGHSRNPGTTADLVTACLFVLLREDTITLPSQIPWAAAGVDHV